MFSSSTCQELLQKSKRIKRRWPKTAKADIDIDVSFWRRKTSLRLLMFSVSMQRDEMLVLLCLKWKAVWFIFWHILRFGGGAIQLPNHIVEFWNNTFLSAVTLVSHSLPALTTLPFWCDMKALQQMFKFKENQEFEILAIYQTAYILS